MTALSQFVYPLRRGFQYVFQWLRSTNKVVRWAGWAVVAVVGFVVLAALATWAIPLVPKWLWHLTAICVVVALVIWWFLKGMPWLERRSFLRRSAGDLAPGKAEDEAEAIAAMTDALGTARQTILRSPLLEQGLDPLYRIPWLLFVGDQAANVAGLLRSGARSSPFPAPDDAAAPTASWRWWFFKRVVAIETSAAFVCAPSEKRSRGIWYRALELLYYARPKLPLNGIVLAIAAPSLLGDEEAVREYGLKLRRLVDEAMEQLLVDVPVYVVITGLDGLPGFDKTLARLPAAVRSQVLGHRLEWAKEGQVPGEQEADAVLGGIARRWHAIGLAAIPQEHTLDGKRLVYLFTESFRSAERNLRTLLKSLTEDNPFQRNPRWRGVYFTATGANPAFVDDLFLRFFPVDQPLATRGRQWHVSRWIRAAIGVGCLAAVSIMLSVRVHDARVSSVDLALRVDAACRSTGARDIFAVINCRQEVELLEKGFDEAPLTFGIDHSRQEIEALKTQLLDDFDLRVLRPFNTRLLAELTKGDAVTFAHHLATRHRTALIGRCLTSSSACRIQEGEIDFIFDPATSFFRAVPDLAGTFPANALIQTYAAYLRWSRDLDRNRFDKEVQEIERQTSVALRLDVTPRGVVEWASARYPPVSIASFWTPSKDPAAISPPSPPVVESAFSRTVGDEVIAPFLTRDGIIRRVQRANPEKTASFARAYYEQYFRAWAAFLADFHRGEDLWKGQLEVHLERCAKGECPHRLLAEELDRQLLSLPVKQPFADLWKQFWLRTRADWTGIFGNVGELVASAWRSLRHGRDFGFPVWVPALGVAVHGTWPEVDPLFLRLVNAAMLDPDGKESYALAAEIFSSNGQSVKGMARDFSELSAKLDAPPDSFAARMGPEDHAAWGVAREPARLALTVVLQRAGRHIQNLWDDQVRRQLQGLPASQQLQRLLGIGGQPSLLNAFVDANLKAFVNPSTKQPISLQGVALPVSEAFKALHGLEVRNAAAISGTPFDVATVAFAAPTRFGMQTEGAGGTTLTVQCRTGGTFTASSRGSLADNQATVIGLPDKCDRVVLKVALPDPPPPSPDAGKDPLSPVASDATLDWIYEGPKAMFELASDFRNGRRIYRVRDFRAFYSPQQWAALEAHPSLRGVDRVNVNLAVKMTDRALAYAALAGETPSIPQRILE